MTWNRPAFAVSVVLIAFSGCSQHFSMDYRQEADFHQVADMEGVTAVVIQTKNGGVDVRCEPTATSADISGTKYAMGSTDAIATERLEQIKITSERDSARPEVLRITAEFPDNLTSAGAKFRVVMPPGKTLDIRASNGGIGVTGAAGKVQAQTSNGGITATGLAGAIDAKTSNGPIKVQDIPGHAEAKSSNGSITLQGIAGSANAVTSNGPVTLRDVAGDVDAQSSNGSIDLERVGKDQVRAKTSNAHIRAVHTRGAVRLESQNGRIELKAPSLPPKPQVRVATSNAGVTVELPANVQARVQLHTANARLHTSLNGAQVEELQSKSKSMSATLNGGGGLVDVQTSNGAVDFTLIPAPLAEQPQADSAQK